MQYKSKKLFSLKYGQNGYFVFIIIIMRGKDKTDKEG